MNYRLAEVNIAKFRLPMEHPVNVDFVQSLDRVNAVAESQPGFVWRFVGTGSSAIDIRAFDDPNIAVNMSVWTDLDSLAAFVYRNEAHREIMRRRREWFDKIDFHLALWWIAAGHIPSIDEAKLKLEVLSKLGPTPEAFRFNRPFPAPNASPIAPILDECA